MTETRGKMKMGRPKKNLPASGSDGGGERCLTCVRPRLGSSKLCEWCLTRTDITRLLPVRLFLTYCNVCSCYLQPPSIHVRAERNSNKLLNHCIRCIWRPLRRTIRLLKAEFIESSDHSVIKVRLLLRGEISEGAISDRYHLTEFTVRHKVCKFCCESSISDTQRRVTRVELRQYHVHLRNTLSCLEKAMSEHGLTCRALWIEEHARGTDYIFSDRNHALDLVQFIQGVVPVKKQSDDDGVSATFFSLHIIPICRDDLIAGSLVGGGDNLVICTEVAAHGISLMDPFTLRAAFLTAEDYWRTPFRVVFNSKLLVEYLVLDIIPDPTDADDVDPYCLAHAHIVPVSDDHNKLMVRTHLGRLLKPGDYVLGYDVGGSATEVILVKKSCQLENKKSIGEPSSQEPRSVDTVLVGDSKDEYEEFLREFEENTRLGLISEESQMLPTSPDDVPSNPEGKWLGDEAAADNTTVECLPSTQLSSPQQWEMQQRLQGPGSLLQAHNAIEQKPLIQTQRALQEVSSSTSADSTAQTGHAGAVDWQEECYQKVLSMKELYYADLSEFHHKINMKLQQQEAQVLPGKQSDQYEKLKGYKIMLDRMLQLLQISSKNSVPIGLKEKLPMYEKQIVNMVTSQRPKKIPPQAQGQQFQHPNVGNAQPVPHQQPSHGSQMQLTDNHANQVQQGPGTSLQSSGSSHVHHASMPSSTAHQNISSGFPPGSNMDSIQGGSFNSRQLGAIGSGQQGGLGSLQTSMGMPQQNNMNAQSQSAANPSQVNIGPMQTTSGVLQQQHIKQEQQQLLQSQQMKNQLQQRNLQHQQTMQQQQRQQLLQHQQPLQQHLHQQQKQQQASQLPVHQIQQLHSMNEINELKARQGSGMKPGLYEYSAGQRHNYYNQQLKPGASYPVSSPQNLQAASPQISHQSSPQIDQNSLLSSISKVKAPMQSANSPLVVTPSTPFAPSPIPVDSEKPISAVGPVGQQQAPVAQPQSHSLAVSTPGISASPLLAECISQDGNQAIVATPKTTERPVDRLIKMVQSLTPKSLSSSVSDIGSVVSMVDRIAGSAPGNGSRTAVGEDLVAMTKCRLQARNFMSQDGGATAKKMKRHTSAMPLNNASSAGSVNEGFLKLYGLESSELESTATSRIKRLKPEANHALLEEIKEINRKLIDTVVDVTDEDSNSVVAAAEGAKGTVVKCSYTAVALSPDLKAQFASAQMSPITPMRLLVPANYPKCSPVILDNDPAEPREFEDLSSKAKSKFSISLRCLSQPMSLGEMVKTWDACARKVILEYAQQAGGGSFSSTYGSWEYCVGA